MNIHVKAAPAKTSTLPKVRLAVEADFPQLVEFGRMLHTENAMMPISEARTAHAVRRAIQRDRQ